MQVQEFLADLSEKGVQLWVEGEQLRVRAPKDAIGADLKEYIANNKADLVAWLQSPENSSASHPIAPRSGCDRLPLSYGQERLWWLSQLDLNSPVYNIPVAFHLTGKIDIAALKSGFGEIVRRHEILRTSFTTVDGKPEQIIAADLPVPITVVDVCQQDDVEKAIALAAREPFDLAFSPLWRVKLLRLGAEECVLVLVMHHAIFDGFSFKVLFQELKALYTSSSQHQEPELPILPCQYADFALWQRESLQGKRLESLNSYWKKQLDSVKPLELPVDKHPVTATNCGARQSLELSPQLTQGIREICQNTGSSLFITLLGIFNTLLYQYNACSDIVTCSPLACRQQPEIEGLIGYFNNIVPLRVDLSGDPTFRELLSRVRRVALEAYAHQDLPFQKLLELPNLGHVNLARTMFNLLSAENLSLELPDIVVRPLEAHNGTANFDLSLSIWEREENLKATLEYKADLFSDRTIAKMLDNFQILLANIVENLDLRLSSLPSFSPLEIETIPEAKSPDFLAPRDALENQIAKIWEEVLNVHPIGVRDNLFALGATSLMAVRMGDRLQQVLHKSIPLATIFQATTIEQLAAILSQEEYALSDSAIAAIQPQGNNPPLFLFEGVGIYYPLVPYLGLEQPIYGLVGHIGKGKLSGCNTIEELAAYYISEMKTVQPTGVYFLGGVSWGGIVALEIAQQLIARGEKVGLLALLDTIRPNDIQPLPIVQRLLYHYRRVTQSGISYILQKVHKRFQKLKAKFNLTYPKLPVDSELASSNNAARSFMRDAYNRAALKYVPQPYPGKITIFAASDRSEEGSQKLPPDLGWKDIAEQGIEIFQIPGDHLGMLKEPHVQVLAARLKSCIAKTRSR